MNGRKGKGLPGCVWVLIFVIILILIPIIGGFAYYQSKLSKINKVDEKKAESTLKKAKEFFEETKGIEELGLEQRDPADIKWPADEELMSKEGVKNIIVVARNPAEKSENPSVKAMLILTMNENDDSIKMTRILNETYGQIPGFSDNRLRTAYEYGGMTLLKKAVQKNFALKIDGTISINYEDLVAIAGKVGNTDVQDITSDEDAYASMKSVLRSLAGAGIPKLMGLSNEILPLLETDLSNSELTQCLLDFVKMGIPDMENLKIPAENTYEEVNINNMAVLVPDLTANRNIIKRQLFES